MTGKQNALGQRGRATLLVAVLLLAAATLVALPATAFGAGYTDGSNSGSNLTECARTTGGTGSQSADWSACLPSGRWSQNVGTILTRTEPAKGIFNSASNMLSQVGNTMRLVLPNMALMLVQVCWNSALALSQFAASFSPLQTMGYQMDKAAATLTNGVMSGGIPATLVVVGILGWVAAAALEVGGVTTKTAAKRLLTTILCIAGLLITGSAAAKSTETTPAKGSPWWVVNTMNNTVNDLTLGLDLDKIQDSNPNMMAYDNTSNPNCQTYLYEMHRQYAGDLDGNGAPSSQSNVTTAINRLWEETALRSWVTMQWGNPTQGASSDKYVAANAQQAYCHVLEASTGTSVGVQRTLTNAAMKTSLNSGTSQWLFSPQGFLDPWNSKVNKDDDAWDRGTSVYLNRMGVFWETCAVDSTGKAVARDGWDKLVNNISDSGSGAIKGSGGSYLRAALGDSKLDAVDPSDDSRILIADTDYKTAVGKLCGNVFSNRVYNGSASSSDSTDYSDSPIGDSATMGWRFDVPNVGAVYREANMLNEDAGSANASVQDTLGYFYGNKSVDTQGAYGSLLGAIVNMVVWGLLSLVLIVSKLMLPLMALFLVAAFLLQAIPIGSEFSDTLKKWAKATFNIALVATLYGFIGTIATMVCQMILASVSGASGTFMYGVLAGTSPALAVLAINLFFTMVLKKGSPLSLRSMGRIVGSGMLMTGMMAAGRSMSHRAIFNGLHRHGHHSETSSRSGGRNSEASASTLGAAADGAAQAIAPPEGSVAEAWSKTKGYFGRTKKGVQERGRLYDEKRDKDILRFMSNGMDPEAAQRKADRRRRLRSVWNGVRGGLSATGSSLQTVGAMVGSKQLRNIAAKGLKTAAKVGVTAAALSNPITAPLGVLMAGKMLPGAVRTGWRAGKGAVGLARNGAEKFQDFILDHQDPDRSLPNGNPFTIPPSPSAGASGDGGPDVPPSGPSTGPTSGPAPDTTPIPVPDGNPFETGSPSPSGPNPAPTADTAPVEPPTPTRTTGPAVGAGAPVVPPTAEATGTPATPTKFVPLAQKEPWTGSPEQRQQWAHDKANERTDHMYEEMERKGL